MSIANLEVPNNYKLYCNSIAFQGSGDPFNYGAAGYSTNVTGPFSGTALGLVRKIGNTVTLSVNGTSGVVTTPADITLSTLITPPPYNTIYYPIVVINNSANQLGMLIIDTTGEINIYSTVQGNTFTTGTCGFYAFTITYSTYV